MFRQQTRAVRSHARDHSFVGDQDLASDVAAGVTLSVRRQTRRTVWGSAVFSAPEPGVNLCVASKSGGFGERFDVVSEASFQVVTGRFEPTTVVFRRSLAVSYVDGECRGESVNAVGLFEDTGPEELPKFHTHVVRGLLRPSQTSGKPSTWRRVPSRLGFRAHRRWFA